MKIFKKTLAMVLSIIMVFGVMPASVFTASAADASACPVEGATGTGTEADPIIVDTYEELKAALALQGPVYVYVGEDTTIECTETISTNYYMSTSSATLTVDGTLHGNNNVLHLPDDPGHFTLKGTGKILSDDGYCVTSSMRTTIEGDLYMESTNNYALA